MLKAAVISHPLEQLFSTILRIQLGGVTELYARLLAAELTLVATVFTYAFNTELVMLPDPKAVLKTCLAVAEHLKGILLCNKKRPRRVPG